MLQHERCEDAPFMGCLISAIDCHINCKNCFNQHLKKYPTIIEESHDIIQKVKSNPFNEGIILAGLEWTEQPEEMCELIQVALNSGLKVMLYTGLTEDNFKNQFYNIYKLNIFIKFGNYNENLKTNKSEYGVLLISKNQHIRKG